MDWILFAISLFWIVYGIIFLFDKKTRKKRIYMIACVAVIVLGIVRMYMSFQE